MFIDFKASNSLILGTKAYYQATFMISFNMPLRYMDTTPYMYLDKIYTYQKFTPILVHKQLRTQQLFSGTISLLILKIYMTFNFLKHLKLYLCLNNILKTSYFYMLLFSNFMHKLHSFNRNIITGGMLTRKPVVSLVSRLILYIFFSLSSHFTIIITCKCTKVTVDRTKINENCYKFVSVSVECEKRSFSSRD